MEKEILRLKIKIIGVSALIFLLIAAVIVTSVLMTVFIRVKPKEYNYPPTDFEKILTEKEVKEDIDRLIEIVERVHPYFLLGAEEDYFAAKEKLQGVNGEMTVRELSLHVAEYLKAFSDVQSRLAYTGERVLDLHAFKYYFDGQNFVSEGTALMPRGAVFNTFNDVSMTTIIETAKKYIPNENANTFAALFNLEVFWLEAAGCQLADLNYLIYIHDNKTHTVFVPMTTISAYRSYYPDEKSIYCFLYGGDILYIDYNQCRDSGNLSPAVEFIKKALADGIKKVIVDVRDNKGGDSGTGNAILDALGLSYCSPSLLIRYSREATRYQGYLKSFGKYTLKGSYKSDNAFGIDLKVLCNEKTAGAALTFVSEVKYSNLGEIIGRSPGQRPDFYGSAITLNLKNSKIIFTLPTNINSWQNDFFNRKTALEPDVTVNHGEDYLSYVIW